MKKTLLVAALMLGASSASAYEVHKKVPAHECESILNGIDAKGYTSWYDRDTHKFWSLQAWFDGIAFKNFWVNEDNGKAFAQNRLTHWCHIFVGTVDDLQKFKDDQELRRKVDLKKGKVTASKYGL